MRLVIWKAVKVVGGETRRSGYGLVPGFELTGVRGVVLEVQDDVA